MSFQEISQKMRESNIVKAYIYLWIIATILFGIGIFIYLNSNSLFSLWINILISLCFVIGIVAGFIFSAHFLLLAGFIEGNKSTIRFEIGTILVVLVALLIFYKVFTERWGVGLFFIAWVVGLLEIIFDFLRLKEL